jgi:hypothetical protein
VTVNINLLARIALPQTSEGPPGLGDSQLQIARLAVYAALTGMAT